MKKRYSYNRFTGTSVSVNESTKGAVEKINWSCNSSQATSVQGKNLFNTTDKTLVYSGVTTTVVSNLVTFNGTSTGNTGVRDIAVFTPNLAVGNYKVTLFGVANADINFEARNASDVVVAYGKNTGNTVLTVTNNSIKYITYYIIGSGKVFSNYTLNIQIESGTTATSYEPFTPDSPTPTYPSSIANTGDTGTLTIRSSNGTSTSDVNITLPVGYYGGSLPNGVADTDTQKKIGKHVVSTSVSSVTIADMKNNGSFRSSVGGTISGTTITFASAVSSAVIYYELAIPVDVTITKPVIPTYTGNNTITSTNAVKPTLTIEAWKR